jgi:membrane-bound serine protease (ClpP class)
MFSDLIWPIVLIVLGMIMLFIEAIVPSFGLIGIAGFMLIGGGVVAIWTTAGMMWGVIAICIAVPVFVLAMVLFFRSRAAKAFVQRGTIEGGSSSVPSMTHLVGQKGIAVTPLRPSGIALINEERIDVVTDGGAFIEKSEAIIVLRLETNSIVVDKTDT